MGIFQNAVEEGKEYREEVPVSVVDEEANYNSVDKEATAKPWSVCKSEIVNAVKKAKNTNLLHQSGLQLVKRLKCNHLRVAGYNADGDSLVTVEESFCRIVTPHRTHKHIPEQEISLLLYVSAVQTYVLYTKDLKLHVYDSNFKCVSSDYVSKPLLTLSYCKSSGDVVAGCINRIILYRFEIEEEVIGVEKLILKPYRIMKSLDEYRQCWFYSVYIHYDTRRVYAAYDSSIEVFEYRSGNKVETLRDRHVGSITRVAFLKTQSVQYFLTAATDGTINVYQAFKHLLHCFEAHRDEVTGLCPHTSAPLFFSCSKDNSLRGFNVSTNEQVFRYDLGDAMVNMELMYRETFLCYDSDKILVYDLNSMGSVCNIVHAKAITMTTVRFRGEMPRVFVCLDDTTKLFLSPVTANTLSIVLPTLCMASELKVCYCGSTNQIYSLFDNGEIWIFSVDTNPALLIDIWYPANTKEDYFNDMLIAPFEKDGIFRTFIFAASRNGQIHVLSPTLKGKSASSIQAHAQSIIQIHYREEYHLLASISKDQTAKLWKVQLIDDHVTLTLSRTIALEAETLIACFHHNFLAFSLANHNILLYNMETAEKVKTSKEDKHIDTITSFAYCEALGLLVTSSLDGSIKLWDINLNLCRELHLEHSINRCEIVNARGDLLISIANQITVMHIQQYMPFLSLAELSKLDFEDDVIEHPTPFDSSLEFIIYNSSFSRAKKYRRKSTVIKSTVLDALQVNKPFKNIIDKTLHDKKIKSIEHKEAQAPELLLKPSDTWRKNIDIKLVCAKKKRQAAHAVAYHRFLRHRMFETAKDIGEAPTEDQLPKLMGSVSNIAELDNIDIAETMRSLSTNYLIASDKDKDTDIHKEIEGAIPTGWTDDQGDPVKVEDVIPKPNGLPVDGGFLLDNGVLITIKTLDRNNLRISEEGTLLQGNGRPADIRFDCIVLENSIFIFDNEAPVKGDLNELLAGGKGKDTPESANQDKTEMQQVLHEILYTSYPFDNTSEPDAYIRVPFEKDPEKIIPVDGFIPNSVIRRILFAKSLIDFSAIEKKRWKPSEKYVRKKAKPPTPKELTPDPSFSMEDIQDFIKDVEPEAIPQPEPEEMGEPEREETPPPKPKKPRQMALKSPSPPPPHEPELSPEEVVLNAAIQKVIEQQWYAEKISEERDHVPPLSMATLSSAKESKTRRLSHVLKNLVGIMTDEMAPVPVREEAMQAITFLHKEVDVPLAERRVYQQTIDDVVDLAFDANVDLRKKAARMFRDFGKTDDPIVKTLIHLLADDSNVVKREAMESLIQLGIQTSESLKEYIMKMGMLKGPLEDIKEKDIVVLTNLRDGRKSKQFMLPSINFKCGFREPYVQDWLKRVKPLDPFFDPSKNGKKEDTKSGLNSLQNLQLGLKKTQIGGKAQADKMRNQKNRIRALLRMFHKGQLRQRRQEPWEKPPYAITVMPLPPIPDSDVRDAQSISKRKKGIFEN
eukprot:Nk52_evm21s208 gene=Nk52_evmTU21s208